MSAHFLEVYSCGCLHRQCRCPFGLKAKRVLPGLCPMCERALDQLIAEAK